MSLNHLTSPTDPVGFTLNPNFQSLLVHGPTTLGAAAASQNVINVGAAATSTTLTAAQSGSLVLVATPTASQTINLPAAASSAGVYYVIIFQGVGGSGFTTTLSTGASNIITNVLNANSTFGSSAFRSATGQTTCVRSGTVANTSAGDRLRADCDGTNWYISGTGFGSGACFT